MNESKKNVELVKKLPLSWAIVIATVIFTLGNVHTVTGGERTVYVVNKLTGTVISCGLSDCEYLKTSQ